MVMLLIAELGWQQITAMARMAKLAAPLAALAIALAAAGSALPGSITGGWLGGIHGAAALLLLQLGDTGRQVLDLVDQRSVLFPELTVLLKQLHQQGSHAGWCRFPISVGNTSGRASHHRRSLPEISAHSWCLSRPQPQLPTCPPLNGYLGSVHWWVCWVVLSL